MALQRVPGGAEDQSGSFPPPTPGVSPFGARRLRSSGASKSLKRITAQSSAIAWKSKMAKAASPELLALSPPSGVHWGSSTATGDAANGCKRHAYKIARRTDQFKRERCSRMRTGNGGFALASFCLETMRASLSRLPGRAYKSPHQGPVSLARLGHKPTRRAVQRGHHTSISGGGHVASTKC